MRYVIQLLIHTALHQHHQNGFREVRKNIGWLQRLVFNIKAIKIFLNISEQQKCVFLWSHIYTRIQQFWEPSKADGFRNL